MKHLWTEVKSAAHLQDSAAHLQCLYLYLYLYNAGTDRGYKCTGRAIGLIVQLLEDTTKALYCLCAHYAILKVVPIDYSL